MVKVDDDYASERLPIDKYNNLRDDLEQRESELIMKPATLFPKLQQL
jgi:hypothetical protein